MPRTVIRKKGFVPSNISRIARIGPVRAVPKTATVDLWRGGVVGFQHAAYVQANYENPV